MRLREKNSTSFSQGLVSSLSPSTRLLLMWCTTSMKCFHSDRLLLPPVTRRNDTYSRGGRSPPNTHSSGRQISTCKSFDQPSDPGLGAMLSDLSQHVHELLHSDLAEVHLVSTVRPIERAISPSTIRKGSNQATHTHHILHEQRLQSGHLSGLEGQQDGVVEEPGIQLGARPRALAGAHVSVVVLRGRRVVESMPVYSHCISGWHAMTCGLRGLYVPSRRQRGLNHHCTHGA